MVECDFCGDEYDSQPALNSHMGHMHPSETRVTVECAGCGAEIERRKKRVEKYEQQFCDESCKSEGYKDRTGDQAPQWDGGKHQLECASCGSSFEVFSNRKDSAKFCSIECRSVYFRGENSPHWKGGKGNVYGRNWDMQRSKARERDGYKCRICGMDQEAHLEEYGSKLEVHHIKSKQQFIQDGELDYENANQLSNLATLCKPCHAEWEGIPLMPE